MGEWANGRMGEWANGRMGEWAVGRKTRRADDVGLLCNLSAPVLSRGAGLVSPRNLEPPQRVVFVREARQRT
jgi:hypothetical protein